MRFRSLVLSVVMVVATAAPALAMGGGGGRDEAFGNGNGKRQVAKTAQNSQVMEAAEPFVLLTLGLGLIAATYVRRKR